MFEKNFKISYLLDFYGDVLDEHVRSVMKAYYDDDLSLAEIAEGVGISRQGVRHLINKGKEQICFLEERLCLARHYEELNSAADKLENVIDTLKNNSAIGNDLSQELKSICEVMRNKG